ncbi:bifunctional tetrahydrofolate synthase/dihydrofolate synthase [Deefgea salmonis]|uniref:Dihydrofolate synthase/folylpolyglutamate synthase n=1 Tax=Deefgea salmonis TaxID=2875502 RepID=A0ABS8BHN4_9NEIS|nr:bifunctional tetrahydrofolate synthase/dihydrofolate synthase [Deefgea salmonis]MCB5195229.1 bifunctional tetrahydrofolate synthase/dihydrofolate synthase [Deefgea salmonis]
MAVFNADDLPTWLSYLESLHPVAIDMGLGRVTQVRDQMRLQPRFPVLTIGGTNGKGSVCAMLTQILVIAGYKVGTYTSPHLLHYNERIAINGQPVADDEIVASFRAIESARGSTSLSYFEFGTLAAMHQFIAQDVDVAIMEVGLGGRLDAVNIFEPTVAAVVSVGIDHQSYLGDTREKIALEKAGIYRSGLPALCADPQPPQTLLDVAAEIGADLGLIGRDFGYQMQIEGQQWSWWHRNGLRRHALPLPALRGQYQLNNACLALAVLDECHTQLPVTLGDIKRGLLEVEWPARFQVLPGRPTVVLDVAHNPHAALVLKSCLDSMSFHPKTHAVLGMMQDKDMVGVVRILADRVDCWYLAAPDLSRATPAGTLAKIILQIDPQAQIQTYDAVADAYQSACKSALEADRILVFGSFFTVAEVMVARGQAK